MKLSLWQKFSFSTKKLPELNVFTNVDDYKGSRQKNILKKEGGLVKDRDIKGKKLFLECFQRFNDH